MSSDPKMDPSGTLFWYSVKHFCNVPALLFVSYLIDSFEADSIWVRKAIGWQLIKDKTMGETVEGLGQIY